MSLVYKFIDYLVKGKANFCCLCFNPDNNITLHDEITIDSQDTERITVSHMIQAVLGNEVHEYVSTFESICEECAKSMITFYTFIRNTHYNAKCLKKVLDWLNNNVDEDIGTSKSVFISVDTKDYTTKHLYDTVKVDTKFEALKRFRFLNVPLSKEEGNETKKTKIDSSPSDVLKYTELLHDPNNHDLVKCKLCLKVYCNKWNLQTHYFRVHAPKIYQCPKCPRSFGSQNILDMHINDSHCEIICSECGKCFRNRPSLVRHELSHKTKLICQNCGRSYKSRVSYRNHIKLNICKQGPRTNPKNAQFTCDYCNKRYTQKMSLRVHIQYEHGNYKAHICEWCGKKFWAQSRLKAHIVKHTREKNFTCTICRSKFVTKESLLYHTRLHTGEKPYQCPECGCNFVSASRKIYHMKTYHQAAMVECDICQSKFSSRTYLHKHKKCHKQPENSESQCNKPDKKSNNMKNKEKKVQRKDLKISDKKSSKKPIDMAELLLAKNTQLSPSAYHEQDNTIEFFKPESGNEYFCEITKICNNKGL